MVQTSVMFQKFLKGLGPLALLLSLTASAEDASNANGEIPFRPFLKTNLKPTEAPTPLNSWVGNPEPRSFYLVMDKMKNVLSARSLLEPGKVFRLYRAISGTNPGDKIKEGDMKTPEGIYFIESRVSQRRLQSLHGPAAFEMNYPNPVDKILKRTGYGIWIHGVENDNRMEKRFDTKGCIAISNKDILDLADRLTMKNIPVVVVDEESPAIPVGIEVDGGPFHERVKAWAAAWSSKNVEDYIKFYHPEFHSRIRGASMNFDQWYQYKKRLTKNYKWMNVQLSDIKILRHGKYAVAIFEQNYESNLFKSKSLKRLYMVGSGVDAQILAEEVAEERPTDEVVTAANPF